MQNENIVSVCTATTAVLEDKQKKNSALMTKNGKLSVSVYFIGLEKCKVL